MSREHMKPQWDACERCSQGVMDAGSIHSTGSCRCSCHARGRPLTAIEAVAWEVDPWCLNGWAGAGDHIHYCRRDYGHLGRCRCEYCRSWTLETPPSAYPEKEGNRPLQRGGMK